MITRSTGYTSSDGTFHATIEDAQKHELGMLTDVTIAAQIFECRDKIIDILTTKPNSLTKARKINGGTKKRTKHIAEQKVMFNEPPKGDAA